MVEKVLFQESLEALKKKVTLQDVLDHYGYDAPAFNTHINCPFHPDDTASMRLYNPAAEDSSFYCFGCGKGGNILSFVFYQEGAKSKLEALKILALKFKFDLLTKAHTDALLSRAENILYKKERKEEYKWDVSALKVEIDALTEDPVPYLDNKKISHIGTKSYQQNLVVPITDVDGKFLGVQLIKPNGEKKFSHGVSFRSGVLRLGPEPQTRGTVYLCEGYATAASVYLSTGITTYCCFSWSNIKSSYKRLKEKYYVTEFIVAGDNDGPGRQHELPGIYPEKSDQDWNDVYVQEGPSKVKELLVLSRLEKPTIGGNKWPKPITIE